MYVLKDAFSFDNHIANQDDYKYGKSSVCSYNRILCRGIQTACEIYL